MVRARGLEPPRASSLDPKSSASTNSATPAGKATSQYSETAEESLLGRSVFDGGPYRDRTYDLGIKSPLLYQLS